VINFTRNPKLYFIPALIVGLTIMFFGCEGPAGADGTAGDAGTAGTDGLAGVDGVDANETCKVCHNSSDTITAKVAQYNASLHATGGHAYYGSMTSCAPCHTSQGFLEVVSTGDDATVAAIPDPAQPNCRTCHKVHNAYDITDWALTTTTAVVPLIDATASIDIGDGNLCARCHQARPADVPAWDATVLDSTSLGHFGPHYGPQSNLLAGISGWEVKPTGFMAYDNSAHTSLVDGCITCHMADAYGAYAGGHTMKIRYKRSSDAPEDDPRFYDEGCETCHTTVDGEDKADAFAIEVQALLDALETDLVALGALIWDTEDEEFTQVTGKFNDIVVGAVWNYVLVLEDKSMGAHNPKYVEALLTNAKLALDAL